MIVDAPHRYQMGHVGGLCESPAVSIGKPAVTTAKMLIYIVHQNMRQTALTPEPRFSYILLDRSSYLKESRTLYLKEGLF